MDPQRLCKITPEELEQILQDHEVYLDSPDHDQSSGKRADLHNTDLRGKNLRGRRLVSVNFEGADLTDADVTDADLSYASFDAVVLAPEQALTAKNWLFAFWDKKMRQALRLPNDHTKRVRGEFLDRFKPMTEETEPILVNKLNFSNYDLTGRNLGGSYLANANLENADVQGSDLRNAAVRPEEVPKMRNWLLASWDQDVLAALGLPLDHDDRVARKNFSGYNLEGRDLSICDLSNCDLQNATSSRGKTW